MTNDIQGLTSRFSNTHNYLYCLFEIVLCVVDFPFVFLIHMFYLRKKQLLLFLKMSRSIEFIPIGWIISMGKSIFNIAYLRAYYAVFSVRLHYFNQFCLFSISVLANIVFMIHESIILEVGSINT